eukprot:256233_1
MSALSKIDHLIAFIDDSIDSDKTSGKTAWLTIDSICTFPIKSCGALVMDQKNDSFPFTKDGLKYDRSWMVIDAKTQKKITQRQCPKLALVQPSITKTHLFVNVGDEQCQVALDSQPGDCGDKIAQLLSDFIGIECRLTKNEPKVHAVDSHPLLIVFKESVQGLNDKILNKKGELKYDYSRFRANVLLSGLTAFDEEKIKLLKLNDSTFVCDRNLWHDGCLNVTCIDQKTAQIDEDKEPKQTLFKWKNALFGLGLRTPSGKDSGTLKVGDKVQAMW